MNTTEVTIHLSPDELSFAKEYARIHGLTLEELFDRYVKLLQSGSNFGLHPDIEKFTGIIPPNIETEKSYEEHLAVKHR